MPTSTMNEGWPARYPGRCAECEGPIRVDDMVLWTPVGTRIRHVQCPGETSSQAEVCRGCWTELPVSGICGVCE